MRDARSSPFINAESYDGNGVQLRETPIIRSPFINAYVLEAEDGPDPSSESRRLLLAEIEDEEFEAAIYELAGSAAKSTRHVEGTQGGLATLELTFAPLTREIDAMLTRTSERLGHRDVTTLDEGELDEALAEYSPGVLDPAMEQFFGSIRRVVKKAVSGVANVARKGLAAAASLALAPIISRLRKAMPRLIGRIVRSIVDRLPASLQGHARKLAAALPIPQRENADDETEQAFDTARIQQEFNEDLVDSLLNETAFETPTEHESWRDTRQSSVGINELDLARDRFVDELSALGEGEDPAPAVDRFVPALIPVLKVATKLAGRQRLVSLLSSIVAQLIGKFVGPAPAKALSSAMVDSGLKLVGLEVPVTATAQQAIAATVEDTVRRVAALPDETLDSRTLAEGAILSAFETAAAANFPPLLPARVYWKRPDLRETDNRRGVWVSWPTNRRRKRFKKYSQVMRTRITPRMALAIRSFGETPLADYLNEQLGVEPGETLEAEVHLYEAMPGMLLGEVGEAEGTRGDEDEFHPLTMEAASLLVGEPGLGQEGLVPVAARAMPVGQRFYRLALAQRRAAMIPGTRHRRRRTGLRMSIDTAGSAATMRLFLSEQRAQEIARALRAKPHAGVIVEGLRPVIERLLRIVLSGRTTKRMRVDHAGLAPAEASGTALKRVPSSILEALSREVSAAAIGGLAELFASPARFISATEDAKDGVTVEIRITGLAVGPSLRASIAGQSVVASPAPLAGTKAAVTVEVTPGFAHA